MTRHAIPRNDTAAYLAAAHIHEVGPLTREQLFTDIYFGKPQNRPQKLTAAIDSGWLTEHEGLIGIGKRARDHFDEQYPETPKYVGQIATSREPNPHRPLSKRFIPSRFGNRDDIPAHSVRAEVSFKSVGGGR